MASSRTVMIAGAGIGGLTAALAIAQRGFRVAVFDQAQRLEEIGAGIQLSPNASRVLIALGLGEQLEPYVVAPQELRVMNAQTARVLARAPLGAAVEQRYGAPYWVIHRGDLQKVLLDAVRAHPDIALRLGARVEDFAVHGNGVTIAALSSGHPFEERGIALIGADGLWSSLRGRLGDRTAPRFARHTAWRALVPADAVVADLRQPAVNLWLGRNAHLVHYPVRNGSLVNVVAIIRDDWHESGWSAPGDRAEILARYPAGMWPALARAALAAPAALAEMGALRSPRRLPTGARDRSPCWAMPPIRCCPISRRAPPWRSRTRRCSANGSPTRPTIWPAPCAATNASAAAAPRAPSAPPAATARSITWAAPRPSCARSALIAMGGGSRLLSRYDWLYGWKPT